MNPNTPTAASITHSTVSGEHLCAKVLARYDLDFPVDCVFLQMGCNDTYRVRTGGQTLYLRVYRHGWRSRRQIEAEVEMLDFLSHREQPVSAPVRRRDGRFLTRVSSPEGQRYSVLFTEAPSDRGMRVAEHRDYGSTVAKLHSALDEWPIETSRPQLGRAHLTTEPLSRIKPHMAHRPQDWAWLRSVTSALWQSLEEAQIGARNPEYGWCHGDLPNVHVDRSGRMTLFDFDCCGVGWRSYDIAVVLWLYSWVAYQGAWPRGRVARRWNQFLDGYSNVRGLSPVEISSTQIFVPLRHIWLMDLQLSTIGVQPLNRMGLGDLDTYLDSSLGFLRHWIDSRKLG